jgi:hypothetical protein
MGRSAKRRDQYLGTAALQEVYDATTITYLLRLRIIDRV